MIEYINHLEYWANSKNKIFSSEDYKPSLSEILGEDVKSRFLDVEGNGLFSRATVWESGSIALECIDIKSEKHVIHESRVSQDMHQLDDHLNWWLSEIATYEPKSSG